MCKFKQIAGMFAIHALMLLGAATAWAGRGDVDPNYGEGGRLAIAPSVLLALPGDRLVIGDGTGEGFRVRMVDATGRNVPAFGEGGVVLIDSSAAARTFHPEAAALAPNGDMIFVGSLLFTGAREILRLDNGGQPVLSFGDRGDGFVEPALITAVMAIDPAGKIVLAEGSWNPDYTSCEGTARLQRLLANGQPDAGFGGDGIIEIPNLELCNGAFVFGARADGGVIVGDGRTIVAVDAAGDIDPTFGVDGRLAISERPWVRGLLLPDGGLLIFGSSEECSSSSDTVLLKFDRNGQSDLDFGPGTGSVTVDLGAELLGEPLSGDCVDQLALDPDGQHLVAQLRVYGSMACGGMARLTIDGTPDAGFGRNGLTCLNVNFALIAVQSDGAPLFSLPDYYANGGAIYRLLPDTSPSPGFLSVVATSRESATFGESGGTATVTIERLAGRDGAVSVNYTTAYRGPCHSHYRCYWDSAAADSDYVATSGRLDWASGDDGQRSVTVSVRNDNVDEINEIFGVDFSEPGGGAKLIVASTSVYIADDDEASSMPPPPPPPPASGGGGSVSWATQLALLTLLFIHRRRIRRADEARACCDWRARRDSNSRPPGS